MSEAKGNTETGSFAFGGLDETIRTIAKPGLELSDSVFKVAEDALEAAVKLSERIRENVLEKDAIERAREKGVAGAYREHAHRFVDVAADVLAVASDGLRDWVERDDLSDKESSADEIKRRKRA